MLYMSMQPGPKEAPTKRFRSTGVCDCDFNVVTREGERERGADFA
jgi:hypothetical protein